MWQTAFCLFPRRGKPSAAITETSCQETLFCFTATPCCGRPGHPLCGAPSEDRNQAAGGAAFPHSGSLSAVQTTMAMTAGVRSCATLSRPSPFSCVKVALLVPHRCLAPTDVLPWGRLGKTQGSEPQSGAGNNPLGAYCGWCNTEFPFLGEPLVPMESSRHRALGVAVRHVTHT